MITETKNTATSMKLRPHQEALIEMFSSPDCKRKLLLRGDVGLGKTLVLIALAEKVLKEQPSVRVLFLVPKVLIMFIADKLRKTNIPMQIIDRYSFREMLDSAEDGVFWPCGKVLLLSRDFAKQSDIKSSLANTHWDLVIADEAHSYGGASGELLRSIESSAERMVLSSAMAFKEQFDSIPEDVTLVEWRRDQIIDQDGNLIDSVARPILHEVIFSLTASELNLRGKVYALCGLLEPAILAQNFTPKSLQKSIQSSPSALEGTLQSLIERSKEHDELTLSMEPEAMDSLEEVCSNSMAISFVGKVGEVVENVMQVIDDLNKDSKLDAFIGLLSRLDKIGNLKSRVCVITEYVSTLYYLAAEVESRGVKYHLLHGRMNADERQNSLAKFAETDSVLITTLAQLQGFELFDVTDLVFYDIPASRNSLWVILSRFDRTGRSNQLNIHALVPDNSEDTIMEESIGFLREIISNG